MSRHLLSREVSVCSNGIFVYVASIRFYAPSATKAKIGDMVLIEKVRNKNKKEVRVCISNLEEIWKRPKY